MSELSSKAYGIQFGWDPRGVDRDLAITYDLQWDLAPGRSKHIILINVFYTGIPSQGQAKAKVSTC